ncbi:MULTISPECIES: hypothetical protein [unclassified Crossiella]|uniref:hypothetical protein n=1 Tax=unclassified Crossiella TaxID=2620835 RepID=UPI001FFF88DF|nr:MULTISPECIES: hypothetical protein [unclassified Crossiella]MCK2240474.1 hypothetical protein [Crossiella sp. S99.2]MCK2253075.1 hypothetical protein [Crossiella sp. S99.1]
MAEQRVREWTGHWGEPVRVTEVSEVVFRYRVPGRLRNGQDGRAAAADEATDLAWTAVFGGWANWLGGQVMELLTRVGVRLFDRKAARYRALVRAPAAAEAVRFADVVNEDGRLWLVWSARRMAVLEVAEDSMSVRWQGASPTWLDRRGLRWPDGGRVWLPERIFHD